MTIKIPEDFVKIGHVRPIAFAREINTAEVYLKETRLAPADLERFAAWCLDAAAWCRDSSVNFNDVVPPTRLDPKLESNGNEKLPYHKRKLKK